MNPDDKTKGSDPIAYEAKVHNINSVDVEKLFGNLGFIGKDGVTDNPEDEPTLSQQVYDVFDDMKPSEIIETVTAYFEDVLDDKFPIRAEGDGEDEALEMLNAIDLIATAASSAHNIFMGNSLPIELAERMTESLWGVFLRQMPGPTGGSL